MYGFDLLIGIIGCIGGFLAAQDGSAARGREFRLQSAAPGTVAATEKPAVDARLWIIAFDADFPAEKLPIPPSAIESANRRLGRGPDENGRLPTLGLAVQNKISEFEVTSHTHVLHVRDGALMTDPVDPNGAGKVKSTTPPWNVISAPRILANIGQEALVAVGRPVEYLARDEGGCLRVETAEGVTEGMELSLTPSKFMDKGIRFTGVKLKVTRVESRRPIEGVPFDVGMPIIDTRETQLDITLDDGNIAMMPLPTRAGEPSIIVFLMASRTGK